MELVGLLHALDKTLSLRADLELALWRGLANIHRHGFLQGGHARLALHGRLRLTLVLLEQVQHAVEVLRGRLLLLRLLARLLAAQGGLRAFLGFAGLVAQLGLPLQNFLLLEQYVLVGALQLFLLALDVLE